MSRRRCIEQGAGGPVSQSAEDLRELLRDIERYHMPFGMFGPKRHPPKGRRLLDLPLEYLAWFETHGYPDGRLGRLLKALYELRSNGCDEVLAPLRRGRGDRDLPPATR